MPKATFIESAIYPSGDVYTSLPPCLYSFVLRGKENLLYLLEVVKFKFLFVKSLEIKVTTVLWNSFHLKGAIMDFPQV